MSSVVIRVLGRPITQGSKTKTRWGMRDANGAKLHPWRDTVTDAAVRVVDAWDGWEPLAGPAAVTVSFRFARPAGHYGSGRNAGRVKPSAPTHPTSLRVGDLDKLCRAALDSLTVARVWVDDAQVVVLSASKEWTADRAEREGAVIVVSPVTVAGADAAAVEGEPA